MGQVSHPVGVNGTDLNGSCPPPFLDPTKFPSGGNVNGRFCAQVSELPGDPVCCLPCPATDWLFPESFVTLYRVSEILSAAGLVMCLFLLISWMVLPPSQTKRHYLSICLTIGIIMEALAFVIPLGVRPSQCYDEITPNDMYTSLTCAWSGAFLVGGGLVIVTWTFMRALSMHLQICWDIVPGQRFFYVAQGVGWGIASILFATTMTITGVSFRFGDMCHVNPNNSMADFWGPLLGISVAAALIQVLTFFYCIKVYLVNVFQDSPPATTGSSGLPSYHSSSIRTASARAVYQRVKKVLWLQWRSITIVMFVLVDIIFFAIVWVQMDNALQTAKEGHLTQFLPFLTCLFINGEKGKDKCFAAGQKALANESVALAILMLLSLTGVQTALLMTRWSIFTAWYQFFKSKVSPSREFVSLDARTEQKERAQFELVKLGSPVSIEEHASIDMFHDYEKKSPSPVTRGQTPPTRPERPYRQNTLSFSGPRPPSALGQQSGGSWRPEGGYIPEEVSAPSRTAQSPNYGGTKNPYDWRKN